MSGDVALLLHRAGFGPTPAELAAARQSGYARTLSNLVEPPGPDVDATGAPMPEIGLDPFAGLLDPAPEQVARAHAIRREQTKLISQWWLDRMVVASHQAVERLQFFWQGHWATKVPSAQLMLGQHRALRAARDFTDMAHRMVADRALVYWLDGQHNKKDAPNENLARELFELFMLGIGNYTEKDVKEAARALTGYRVALDKEALIFDPQHHDTGLKSVLGTTANLNARGLVDLVLTQKSCPRFIASRMWYRYASASDPIPERVQERMAAAFPRPLAMLKAMFEDDAFGTTAGTMVKQPVEWFVGALRHLGLRPARLDNENFDRLYWALDALGQRPFAPPSVGGWPAGTAWLTSAAANGKLAIAKELVDLVDPAPMTPESVAYVLCVEKWTDRTYAVMKGVTDPRLLLTLGLVSPEYQVT
ncbi:DUF1800 domain-containing protein [Rhizomonospora bruguierae]|uniref:DUF1800 domain-containing protein n=1 Tax=Rhizomonospora bruguierae TaxID=1581705 RepID=UPI001BCCF83A|nr:DUF1800 family protein [Micromonospora sp. NBRC 107566]